MRETDQIITAAPPSAQATASAVDVGKLAKIAPFACGKPAGSDADTRQAEDIDQAVERDASGEFGAWWAIH